MKSRRKIWSIPIAALALVLMLAGALAVSSIVQAQSAPSVPSSIAIVAQDGKTDAILTYKVSAYDPAEATDTTGYGDINKDVASVVVTEVDADGKTAVTPQSKFKAEFKKAIAVKDGDADTRTAIQKIDGITLTADNALKPGYTYTVKLTASYDSDISTDLAGDNGVKDGNPKNDDDGELVTTVTVYVPDVKRNLTFQVDPAKVVNGEVISQLGRDRLNNPLSFDIKNLGPGTATVSQEATVTDVKFETKGSDKVIVKAGKNGLDKDDKDLEATITIDRGDFDLNDKDDDNIFDLKIEATIQNVNPLAFAGSDGQALKAAAIIDGIHYSVTIPETTVTGSGFLPYYVSGAGEHVNKDKDGNAIPESITGVIGGASASLFSVDNDTMAITYIGTTGDLTAGDTHVLRLTASGDSGLANRLVVGMVKITIADVDNPPIAPATKSATIKENDTGDGLVEIPKNAAGEDMEVLVKDFAGVASDPEERTLTYSVTGADFKVVGTKLLVAEPVGDITSDGDNPATTTVVETDWPKKAPNDWSFAVDPPTSKYPDLTRVVNVTVSDGVPNNDKTIKLTITLDVNEPTTLVADAALPVGVEAGKVMVDVDDDPLTPAVEMNGYKVAKSVADRDVPQTLFGLDALVSDSDAADKLTFTLVDDAPHLVHDRQAGDNVLLTYLPPDANPGPRVDVIKVNVSDGFNMVTTADVTTYIEVSITEVPPPPVFSQFVDITVAENSLVCSQVGVASGCSLAGLVDTADSFSIESGVDGGDTDYAIDITTGAITVVTAPNYEDSKSPAFFVNVKDDLGDLAALVSVRVTVTDVNEAPKFADDAPAMATIAEEGKADRPAMDADGVALVLAATDEDAADTGAVYSIAPATAPFAISVSGAVTEAGELEAGDSYILTITATDRRDPALTDTQEVTISVGDINEAPYFTEPSGEDLTIDVPENVDRTAPIVTFEAMDPDANDTLKFSIRDEADKTFFSIDEESGELTLVKDLDYETKTELEAHVVVTDAAGLSDRVKLIVNVGNENDEPPVIGNRNGVLSVNENAARGTILGDYSATDLDGDAITYSLSGADAKSFRIPAGVLMTLEALDADSNTPCGLTGCHVKVVANDTMHTDSVDVTITVINVEDSVSTFDISKANPVPGVTMGDAMSALGDAKESMYGVPESPADLPATDGDAPMNFVDTQWANWGTVLRIKVTSISPGPSIHQINPPANACRGGNECVKITLKSDSGDETLVLEAYRGAKDNVFIAAVMPVSGEVDEDEKDYSMESSIDAYERMNPDASAPSMYKHPNGGGVARLEVDEEDEITISFGNLRGTIDVENEKPEFNNFTPEHEAAFDDGDVDYTFTITDPVSGIPDPEDLPDIDGDGDYMPLVAVISDSQCIIKDDARTTIPKGYTKARDVHAVVNLYCDGQLEIRDIVDDRDFDEIDDGFEVETKIVLDENEEHFVSFIVCDAAGNCAMYTPDESDKDEALAQITIDTVAPGGKDGKDIVVRTGIKWDSTDNKYDDDRTFIQVIFQDLTPLNEDTIEIDDFVVEGHTIKSVKWYDFDANDDDADWSTRFDKGGTSDRWTRDPMFRSINRSVFLELEDELAADETPDVTVVPNGIEDSAGNEQDDGDKEAADWIAPSFTVVSMVSPRTPEGSSNVLAGDGDEVVVTLTVDERIQQTRPNVSVDYVNAPVDCVNTDNRTTDNPYDRGEIKTKTKLNDLDHCGSSAVGGDLQSNFEKVSNTEWIITIDEPDDTGYYNFYVSANDRSAQTNKGSEGIAKDDIVVDFFERDGDVNSDDAHYFQGDINLGNPGVRVSGVQIEDTEPAVEFKTPLFVELDFTRPYTAPCYADDDDDRDANCLAESDEYEKDSFDSVTVTSFVLNGVDMTDSVKTTDNETFLVSIDGIGIGDHEIEVQAMDQAGNTLDKSLSIEFEVEERDPFSRRLNPGWNLVSLPGEPADSDISVVFGSNVEVRTVYTYDPIIPGGWMVAVRETLDSDWQGDLMDITARRGYWVLSDAIQDWEVSIPRLAGGAVGSGTPIQPPVIGLYAGWNLIPVVDVRGGALDDGKSISATAYLNSLDDGLDLARVLGFNTITNTWTTVLDPDDTSDDAGELRIGSGYWVFVREAASLVPGGIAQ